MRKRPAGITNEEYDELSGQIRKMLNDYSNHFLGESSPKLTDMSWDFNALRGKILTLLDKYFLEIPAKEKKYVDEYYVKLTNGHLGREIVDTQRLGCEICGSNKNVDLAHIIPRSIEKKLPEKDRWDLLGKNLKNLFILCPNHHRLFDRGMLSKSEWDKLTLKGKYPPAKDFFYNVLLLRQKHFWDTNKSSLDLDNFFIRAYGGMKNSPFYHWIEKYCPKK